MAFWSIFLTLESEAVSSEILVDDTKNCCPVHIELCCQLLCEQTWIFFGHGLEQLPDFVMPLPNLGSTLLVSLGNQSLFILWRTWQDCTQSISVAVRSSQSVWACIQCEMWRHHLYMFFGQCTAKNKDIALKSCMRAVCMYLDHISGLAGVAKTCFATDFNQFKPAGRNPLWQKLAKTLMTKTVIFLFNNCLKRTNMCLDVIWTYSALYLTGFLVDDYLKCVSMSPYWYWNMLLCRFSACKFAWSVLYI